MARFGLTVVNALEENFSGVRIISFGDVFLGGKTSRFVASEVNANNGVDFG